MMRSGPPRGFQKTRSQKTRTMMENAACFFCVHNVAGADEKDVMTLRKFLSSHGKIMPRRRSGLCASHQRKLAQSVKRARILSLIPFVV